MGLNGLMPLTCYLACMTSCSWQPGDNGADAFVLEDRGRFSFPANSTFRRCGWRLRQHQDFPSNRGTEHTRLHAQSYCVAGGRHSCSQYRAGRLDNV